MVYVVDSNCFRVLGNYYPARFPTFWKQLDDLVQAGRWTSVREVYKEIERQNVSSHVDDWVEENKDIFSAPTSDDMVRVAEILAVPHFQQLIGAKQRLRGMPVADPFVVARGIVAGACVVTEEVRKPNAAKIPNVCDHFGVDCVNLEELMEAEGWQF